MNRACRLAGLDQGCVCFECGEFFQDLELVAVVRCGFDQSRSGVFHRVDCLGSALGRIEQAALEVG